LVEAGGYAVMQCTGTAWAKAASCASGEICVEAVVGGKIGASCKAQTTTADATNGNDTSAATDAAAGGDATLVDVNIIGQDGSSPSDSTTVSDATTGKDTSTGSDSTTGKDTTTSKDSTTGKDTLVKADISASSDFCGNTLCGPQETETSCFIDCTPVAACIWSSCPTEKAACLNNATCKSFVECVGACSDENCQAACGETYPSAESFMEDLDACGETEGCTTTGSGSCSGVCGASEDQGGCFCDDSCVQYDDCCGDYESECGGGGGTPTGTCQGMCGSEEDQGNCYCDEQCVEFEDCCPDYNQFCPAP
jgi:hypothetical protein